MADPKKNPLIGAFRTPAPGESPPGTAKEQKPPEQPKVAGAAPGKADEKKPPEQTKTAGAAAPGKADEKSAEPPKDPNLRYVKISDIQPLPGTYVKDAPRADYSDLIDSIKKSGLEKPVILRQAEKGGYQLVDGFHRCEALKQAGVSEIRADVYDMTIFDASRYRKG